MVEAKEKRGLVPREGWSAGPWDDEPDRVDWIDEATGYPCLIIRQPHMGNLCGYVAVPPGHRLHGTSYWDVDVEVHGDLTYSDFCMKPTAEQLAGEVEVAELAVCHAPEPGEPDDVFWFGFDCAHGFDFVPAMEARLRELAPHLVETPADDDGDDPFVVRYRNLAYVRQECVNLAAQLAERA